MDKLKMHSPDLTQDNIARIRELFPGCVTEAENEDGNIRLAVDFDQLRQELSDSLVEGPQERYHLDWPGKRQALLTANAPIAKTLRPYPKESLNFDTTQNLFIEGDNLDALKLLQETYLGKVKMIYIDPPYNTGNDFVYEDDFAENTEEFLKRSNQKNDFGHRLVANLESNGRFHSDWLSMIYPRLKLAKNLLSDNGLIFISIDDNEEPNLRRVCDDVFGPRNFVATYVWKARSGKDHTAQFASVSQEYVLCYCKEKSQVSVGKDIRVRSGGNYCDDRGNYRREQLRQWGTHDRRQDRPTMYYPVIAPDGRPVFPLRQDGSEGRWRISQDRMNNMIKCDNVDFVLEQGQWRLYAKQRDGAATQTAISTLFDDVGTSANGTLELKQLFSERVFPTTKPIGLINRLNKIADSDSDDIILDFFAGGCTTAHTVMQLNAEDGGNRRFIMVQLPEPCDEKSEAYKAGYKTIAEIGKERIRRAGKKILEGTCHENWNKDVGFRVLKVDASNMEDVYYTPDAVGQDLLSQMTNNIKPDRSPEDLLFQVLLDWGVELSLPIRKQTIEGKNVFFVDENALVACFDKGINEELVKKLAEFQPLRVVFTDGGFVSDAVKINVEQIFRQLSPGTEVKTI